MEMTIEQQRALAVAAARMRMEAEAEAKGPGVAEDVWDSAKAGLGRGVVGLAGAPADIASAVSGAYDWVDAKVRGLTDEQKAAAVAERNERAVLKPETLEHYGTEAMARDLETGNGTLVPAMPGLGYEPKTGLGKLAKTGAEMAPGAVFGVGGLARRAVTQVAAPALGAEGAAAVAPEGYEGVAKVVGAIAGGASTGVAGRAVTPFPSSPERQRLVEVLRQEGVTPTAGQATGSKRLQAIESEMGGHRAAEMMDEQKAQFTRAAMRRSGTAADNATGAHMDNAFQELGDQFEDLGGRSMATLDPQIQDGLLTTAADYQSVVRNPAPIVEQTVNRIGQLAGENGGALSGEAYKAIRSDLSRHIKSADPETKIALRQIQEHMDDAVERSIGPADAEAWRELRNNYRNLIVLEKAAAGAGADAAEGLISPAQLRTAVKTEHGQRNYVRGRGDFNDLARAGATVLTELPDSGTAKRLSAHGVTGGVGTVAGALLGGQFGTTEGALGALAGSLAPRAVGAAVMSRPGQALLQNQAVPALGQDARRAAIIQALMGL